MDEVMDKLEKYFKRLEKQGATVPSCANQKKPNFSAISAAAGIDLRFLTDQRYKNRIALAVEEIGLPPIDKLRRHRLKEHGLSLLIAYIRDLKRRGIKLPENPKQPGKVFYVQVEAEAGISRGLLTQVRLNEDGEHNSALLKVVEDAIPTLGLETRVLRSPTDLADSRITYRQLLKSGSAERKSELEGRRGSAQQLYNTRWGLGCFRRSLGLDEGAPIGPELFGEFDIHLNKVLEIVIDEGTRRKVQTEARWWADYYRKMVKAQSMPEDINGAIAYLVETSGLSITLLANLVGTSSSHLKRWSRGDITPNLHSRDTLTKMESVFKLPTGTLLGKIPNWNRRWRFRRSALPEFIRNDKTLLKSVRRHLPDNFCDLAIDEQREIVDSIRKNVVSHDDAYTRRLSSLRELKFRLTKPPARLSGELNEFFLFKTAERPPLGMRRDRRWRPTSKDGMNDELAAFFGSLRLPVDAEEPRLRGLGIPVEQLTTALIACPLIVDWHIRFQGEIRTQYTEHQLHLLRAFQDMLKAGTGWLRQKPQLSSRLLPVSVGEIEFISPEFIARAQNDWDGVCNEAIGCYQAIKTELEGLITISRDPFARIEGIVEMENPMDAIGMLIAGMRADWPNPRTAPRAYHINVRDTALALLIGLTGFRRLTVVKLNYTGDELGHLFWNKGKYILKVPRQLFKEENSPFFGPKNAQTDYFMEVPDVHDFNEIMTTYLKCSRPWLIENGHPEIEDHPLFVNSGRGGDIRMLPDRLAGIYASATALHLAENKWRGTGIPKVSSHRSHSVRYIRGTAVVKRTGSFQLAADANHHSEKMSRRHYARFAPKDRNSRVNDVLF
jgi:hypothetical protein